MSRHSKLVEHIAALDSVLVAFSGGVDSAVVLKACVLSLGAERVIAVTGRSPSVAAADLADSIRVAAEIGATHRIVDTKEFANPNYVANPTNRCYFCKTTLYAELERLRGEVGFRTIVNGTNADDLSDYRPGLRAAEEHRVRSPLVELGFGKRDVRELAATWGLSVAGKPASPCLSSRVPYGQAISPERLRRIEAAEALVKRHGFRDCRVRDYETVARIEVPKQQVDQLLESDARDEIETGLRELGWRQVTIDLAGLRSGNLNVLNGHS